MIQAVEYIFSVCSATYGAEWDRSLGRAPIADTKTAWLNAVAPFAGSKKRIMWALQNLPERCPNPIQFRNLCQLAPMPETPALPAPKADPERMAAELAKLGHMRIAPTTKAPHGFKQWAYTLKAREAAGDRLNPNQKRCWREALGAA